MSMFVTLVKKIIAFVANIYFFFQEVDVQQLFDQMRAVVPGKVKHNRPTSHVMRTSTLDAAVTPVTVQAHPPSPQQQPSTETRATTVKQEETQAEEPERPSTAASALTAAMEAAAPSNNNSASTSTNTSTHSEPSRKKPIDPEVQQKPLPLGPIACECEDHLDKVEAKVTLPCTARALYEYMFSDKQSGQAAGKNGIWAKLNAEKQNTGMFRVYIPTEKRIPAS